ncbi:MAG: AraC family transcriptional regulator [Betaproteobacteria bacterium]|nr:AraC family transcriptional regulator [Betaproteobacteria bacterium]
MSLDDPFEKIAWLRSPQLGGWEYLVAHRSRHLWVVYHDTYTLCACVRLWGQSWRYRGRIHTLPSPGIMLMEPGELHRTLSLPNGAEFKVAQIPPAVVADTAGELGMSGVVHLCRAQADDPGLTAAVWRLGELAERGRVDLLEVQTLQAVVLRHLLSHAECPPRAAEGGVEPTAAVGRAREYLRTHVFAQVTLDELATVAGIGRFRLLRAFQRRFGVPPHTYQTQLRIERARAMLRKGMTPAMVSTEVGFCDQSHFTRHFKKIIGVTPSEYARG